MRPTKQDSILIVEDEQDIAELIKVHMEDLNINVTLYHLELHKSNNL